MTSKLLLLAIAGLSLAACNNKSTTDTSVTSTDTTSRTTADNTAPAPSSNSNGDAMKTQKEDSTFLAKASETGVFEIEAAKLAKKNSQNADVKGFADMMSAEHTAMGKDVQALAKSKNIILPVGMGDDNKKEWDKLSDLKGAKFDKEYADVNVKGHKEAISLFEKTSTNKDNSAEAQQLATAGLPKLKTHKEHADALKDKLKM